MIVRRLDDNACFICIMSEIPELQTGRGVDTKGDGARRNAVEKNLPGGRKCGNKFTYAVPMVSYPFPLNRIEYTSAITWHGIRLLAQRSVCTKQFVSNSTRRPYSICALPLLKTRGCVVARGIRGGRTRNTILSLNRNDALIEYHLRA